jgi:hypothetical protein
MDTEIGSISGGVMLMGEPNPVVTINAIREEEARERQMGFCHLFEKMMNCNVFKKKEFFNDKKSYLRL